MQDNHPNEFTLTFEEVIDKGLWLQDRHIDRFAELLKAANSEYEMQSTWKVQIPHFIDQISPKRKHLQILHSCDNIRTNENGHWVCLYYDTQKSFIYDSLNKNQLHMHHKKFISKLFPFYPLEKIIFCRVQQQSNARDCGVFSIAFAVSVLCGLKPENVVYTASEMRKHLSKIFANNALEHFPSTLIRNEYDNDFPSLYQSIQKTKESGKPRIDIKQNIGQPGSDLTKKGQLRLMNNNNTKNSNVFNKKFPVKTNCESPLSRIENEPSGKQKIANIQAKNNAKRGRVLPAKSNSFNDCKEDAHTTFFEIGSNNLDAAETDNVCALPSAQHREHKNLVGSICTSSIDRSVMTAPTTTKKRSLGWAARKDETNKRRRDKYAALKLNKQEQGNHDLDNTGSLSVASSESANHSQESKRLRQLKWALRKDQVNNARREKYALRTASKRKRDSLNEFMPSTDYSSNEDGAGDIKRKRCITIAEVKRFVKQIEYASNIENETHKEQTSDAALKEDRRQKKAIRNKKNYERRKKISVPTLTKINTAKNISRKYRKIRAAVGTKKLLHDKNHYVTRVTEILGEALIENRMEAERIIKWCFHMREKYLFGIKTKLKSLKEKAEVSLTQISECINASIEDKIATLCGPIRKHEATSEAYFAETSYEQPLHFFEAIVMNNKGQAINILPINSKKKYGTSWNCSSLCKSVDNELMNTYKLFLEKICECSLRNVGKIFSRIHKCTVRVHDNKLGHSHTCYSIPTECKSLFLCLEFLSPHFPKVRIMKRIFYAVQSTVYKLNTLDEAMETNDVNILRDVAAQAQRESRKYKSSEEIDLAEDSIIETHFRAFKLLTKRSIDTPQFGCVSCEKLCYQKDVAEFDNFEMRIVSPFWTDLITHIRNENIDSTYICNYCLKKFRSNKLPPTCILNKLISGKVPTVLSNFNDYEKILIQRAKAFQIVQQMGTVASKNMPHREMNKKVVGRTFHLPLPIKETLNRICPVTDPLNREHELYILVRGIPTKSKIVWENLVNVQKVYNALEWLKENNPIYSKIMLPQCSRSLLKNLSPAEFELQHEEHDAELECETKKRMLIDQKVIPEDSRRMQRAFLTQKSQSDTFYEQFTIHPMYCGKENKPATELYQMLKIQDVPLANHYKLLDLKCFPDLFPYGINGQHEERTVPITSFEFFKTKLMSIHERYRQNLQYIFYAVHDNNIRQLSAGIFHKMNVTNATLRYTAGSYLEQLAKGELEGNLNTVFARLRNTEQFWRKPRSDLNCMIRHYGPATWFLTLSPSEYMWPDLIQYLREINPSIAQKSANSLIAADPVSVSRFMENKFRAMLGFICTKSNPIGEVIHYFWRREYQTRGTQHYHLLIWIKGAPILGKSSTEEVVNFISKYVTCRIPEKNVSPVLHRRVTTHQNHKHNSYCMRSKKSKTGTTRACRFGFPRPVTDTFIMRNVAASVAGRKQLKSKSRLYDLPRSEREKCINDYNPAVLTSWEGNMDIQFIGETSALLTWYCTKYISKKEKSYVIDVFDEINSTKPLRSRLWNFALRTLCNRECGAPEAADSLLGFSLYGSDPSTSIKWIDVNIIRSRKLKPYKEIKVMAPEATDIFYRSLVDHYYLRRPIELDKVNLYDFAKWYDIIYTKPKRKVEYYKLDDGKFLKKRKRAHLINHYQNDVNTQPEKYFFALLLLFQPWRDVDELKNGYNTYAESFLFMESQLTEALQYHERLVEIKENFNRAKELVENQIADNLEQEANENQDECEANGIPLECNPLEADDAMKDFVDIGEMQKAANVTEMISELNADQKRIFDMVTETINSDKEILRLYVSGEGGTGKSFLISTIRCWIKQVLGKDTAVAAPTGIAAFNIDGLTVHRLFQLPVEHGQTPKYKELSDAVLKTLRDQLKDVSLIIVDEVSMISNITLLYIHLRLTEIFNTSNTEDGWFGKKHVLLFGDLLQLPPVREEPAFIKVSTSKAEKLLESLGSPDIWSSLFRYDELIINMRQKNDTSYKEILSRIRLGVVTAADTKILESRKIKFSSLNFSDRVRELCEYIDKLPSDCVCLLATRYLCDVLNESMLNRIPSEEIQVIAYDSIDCAPYNKKKALKILDRDDEDSSRTAGLAKLITVKIGTKIMLRRNIDVTLGLVNGTIGKIISVSRTLDTDEIDKIKIILSNQIEYEIERVSVKFQIMDGVYVIRKQFPLCLSYGITIHKSQGLSLKNAVIDCGNSIFSVGQVYVALSRITSLEGLHLINYDPYAVKANESSVIEYNRLRQLYRPDLIQIKLSEQRGTRVSDFTWAIPKGVTECQQQPKIAKKSDKNTCSITGLRNVDGMSCYANATIQCMFNSPTIRNELISSTTDRENALAILLQKYIRQNKELDSFIVKQFAGEPFSGNRQQDAAKFLVGLCNKSEAIKNAVEHQLTIKTLCQGCQYTIATQQPNNILLLTLPSTKKVLTLQEIIDYNSSIWNPAESKCDRCGVTKKVIKTSISTTKQVLVVQLVSTSIDKDTLQLKKIHCDIKAVPTTTVVVCSRKYKVKSALFHHGSDVCQGHYTSMLKSSATAWILADDTNTEKKSWPRNARDCYMFFFEQIRK